MTLRSTVDNTERILVGLAGRGIRASRSPRLHENEADAQGMRLIYSLFDFAEFDLTESDLRRLLDATQLAGFSGLNITHPFKQAVIPLLDGLSDEAERIGAVNTVAFRDRRKIGYNTDVTGFADAFRHTLGSAKLNRVIQIGAGGGGAATAYALLELGVRQLSVFDRDRDRAAALVERLGRHFGPAHIVIGSELTEAIASADGLVNATPMGMAAYPGMAVPAETLRSDLWVADIVYFPLETALLAAARKVGCRVMDGSGMAVFQAVGAFEIFTGCPADAVRMGESFRSFDS